jgi:hypothetical protein
MLEFEGAAVQLVAVDMASETRKHRFYLQELL